MTLVIIPSRMGSTRLPGKPLLKIGDKTIIERCVEQARKAGFEPIVALEGEELYNHLRDVCRTVVTSDCASGTDRVAAAAEIIDPEGKHEFVINYQGDMPFLDPEDLKEFVRESERNADLTTAYCKVPYVSCLAGNFIRETVDCHIGLYGFARNMLRKFAATPQNSYEKNRRLEQMRFHGEWDFVRLPSMPIEINTQADLDRARSCLM